MPFSYSFQVALIFSHVTFPSRVFPLCFLRGEDDSLMKHKLHVPQSQETIHGFAWMDRGLLSPLLYCSNRIKGFLWRCSHTIAVFQAFAWSYFQMNTLFTYPHLWTPAFLPFRPKLCNCTLIILARKWRVRWICFCTYQIHLFPMNPSDFYSGPSPCLHYGWQLNEP